MRVAIIGATGLLGKYLMRAWTQDEISGFGSKHLDIRNQEDVDAVIERTQPDCIVLAAAYTDVDGCELNPELAKATNFEGAVNVATAARSHGARIIFLSTDYVFDGSKASPYEVDDQRNPQNVYGTSKAEAEIAIQALHPDSCIARTSWLFGTGGKCFPDTILKAAAGRDHLRVVNDQRGCPTYAGDLALAIIDLCHRRASGVVHVTNTGNCTWFDFASEIARLADLPTEIEPTSTADFPRPAKRPLYSVLSSESVQHYGITMPTWQDALGRYLEERATMEMRTSASSH